MRWGGTARDGEVGTGFGFDLDDDAGTVTLPSKRVIRWTVGGTVRARGRVTAKGVARGGTVVDDARQFDVEVDDANTHLYGIVVHGWVRPEETDVARITA